MNEFNTRVVSLALDKKAMGCKLLDVSEFSSLSDFVFLCSADNPKHVQAIADNIMSGIPKGTLLGVDGMEAGQWVILDCGNLIVHVLLEGVRDRLNLDQLFDKGKRVELPQEIFLTA